MTALLATEKAFRLAKSNIHDTFPEIKSSHLSEALSVALGFNTHAAWIQHLKDTASDPDIRLLDPVAFERRILALGYSIDWDGSAEAEFMDFEDGELAFATSSYDVDEGKSLSLRERAWQNLMVVGINAGLRQKIFGLRADDNRWLGYAPDRRDGKSSCIYHFQLEGMVASAFVHDIGYGELAFHVVLQPTGKFMSSLDAGFSAGEASAGGWLERRKGLWLQNSSLKGMFSCREHLLERLAHLEVRPTGYGLRGKFFM